MTDEKIKNIKATLKNCADTYRDCSNCTYSRKNTADGISHCRDLYLDALELINESEKGKEQAVTAFAEYLKDYVRQVQDFGYEGIGIVDIDQKLKEFIPNANLS